LRNAIDKVATGGYILIMQISVKDAKNQLSELLHRAEAGETVVLTRHGKPVADLVPHVEKKRGINWEALAAFKKAHGIDRVVDFIPADFDDPLPEDFLLRPLPTPK
jgi:prevent-host-death family protein